jgi:hypothetical protein
MAVSTLGTSMRSSGLLALVVATIVTLPALAIPSAGDGMVSVHFPDAFERWGLTKEHTQFGLVNLENGLQQMIIAINIDANELRHGDRAVWLFPVPSAPQNVSIEMLPEVPSLQGERLSKMVEDSLGTDLLMVCSSQIYPLLFVLPFLAGTSVTYSLLPKIGMGYNEVDVYEHLEKFGMTTEVIGTESSSLLDAYLQGKDLSLPAIAEPAIETYIGENFSFVLSWISDTEQFIGNNTAQRGDDGNLYYTLGVWISFPSEKVFYPLRLTSVYGEDAPPMLLQVMGFVSQGWGAHSNNFHARMECYVSRPALVNDSLAGFFNVQPPEIRGALVLENLRFTEIMLTTSANGLSDDLTLDASPPARAGLALFVIDHSWVLALLIFILSSMLASLLAGMICFRHRHPAKTKFALFGLFNFLTIIGVWFAAKHFSINEKFVNPSGPPAERESIPSYLTVFTLLFIASVFASFATVIEVIP